MQEAADFFFLLFSEKKGLYFLEERCESHLRCGMLARISELTHLQTDMQSSYMQQTADNETPDRLFPSEIL